MTLRTNEWILEAKHMGAWKQAVCILAGPAGNFLLLLLCRVAPKIALCGLFQGVYNLLPVMPLDGGRIIQLILYNVCPKYADDILFLLLLVICIGIDLLAVWMVISLSTGIWPIITAASWNIKFLTGNIACKPSEIKVQ